MAAAERRIAAQWPKRVWSPEEIAALDVTNRFPSLVLADALEAVGVLKREIYRREPDSAFLDSDDWEEDKSQYEQHIQYVIIGQFMTLIDSFKSKLDSEPYFISFHADGGKEAAVALHNELRAAGVKGFLSDEILTGATWREDIIAALKHTRTLFQLESAEYHRRPRCQVERDFALAAGSRVLRVGLADRGVLLDVPLWLDGNVQYQQFQAANGLNLDSVLALELPNPVSLTVRKRGASELVDRVSGVDLRALASRLDCHDELHGSEGDQRTQLIEVAFSSTVAANRFCQEIDLLPMF